jgi:hypothetical protein
MMAKTMLEKLSSDLRAMESGGGGEGNEEGDSDVARGDGCGPPAWVPPYRRDMDSSENPAREGGL